MFSANSFNNSFFKKSQTYAFQLKYEDVLSLDILRLTTSSPRLGDFEFILTRNNGSDFLLKNKIKYFKILSIFNFYNFQENYFFENYFVDNLKISKKALKKIYNINTLRTIANFSFSSKFSHQKILSHIKTLSTLRPNSLVFNYN
jgi:hypothetical protein